MSKAREQLYEGMYILNTALSDEARGKALERLQQQIVDKGGEIKKVHDWGRRRLAYQMDGKREGHYYILYFSCPTAEIKELWSEYHLNEDLIRFMTLTADKVMDTIEFKPLTQVQE